ncbi:MAG: MBL fold metallo-hydrolase [Tissierellia bacterium]|nr:MBL fold metallo-hydrolase [Tissierellia bacterium]
MANQVIVKYIYHSCYQISIGNQVLIFDYFEGDLSDLNPQRKDVTFFATHRHPDHFDRSILELPGSEFYRYVLSDDIPALEKRDNVIYLGENTADVQSIKPLFQKNVHYMHPNSFKEFDNLTVRTFGSTDQGLSYLVEVDGIHIFHAGDLNLWIWDEDTERERAQMQKDFLKEIKEISNYDVDIAFFPLDPRLKKRYSDGARIFLDEVKPTLFFPMHFRDDMTYNISFLTQHEKYKQIYRPVIKRNQIFLINYEA